MLYGFNLCLVESTGQVSHAETKQFVKTVRFNVVRKDSE